jgi:hypothetical protein
MSNKSYLDANSQEAGKPVRVEALSTSDAVATLGLVAARVLQQHGIITLMAIDGVIELVPQGELELDCVGEQAALEQLIATGYTDTQLSSYLRQREARLGAKMATQSSPEDDHR